MNHPQRTACWILVGLSVAPALLLNFAASAVAQVPTFVESNRIVREVGTNVQFGASLSAWKSHLKIGTADGRMLRYAQDSASGIWNWQATFLFDCCPGRSSVAVSNKWSLFSSDHALNDITRLWRWDEQELIPTLYSVLDTPTPVTAIATRGDFLFLGVDSGGSNLGSIRMYQYTPGSDSWSETGTLNGGTCTFGQDLAVSDDGSLLLQGAQCPTGGYIDVRDTSTPASIAFSEMLSSGFGTAVAFSGTDVVASNPNALVGISQNKLGRVYTYVDSGASWQLGISVSGIQVDAHFGAAIDASGTTLVVGAPDEDIGSPLASIDRGAAYVYRKCNSTWIPIAKLLGSATGPFSHFGASIAITDRGILVGAPGDEGPAGEDDWGSVYYFEGLVALTTACFEAGDLSEWSSSVP